MRIGVIGCGPAGLLAAHAAQQNGHEVMIFSKRVEKSQLYGSQYLHKEIPGIYCGPKMKVRYELRDGTLEDYRRKVYGSAWDGDVSPGTLDGEHDAWDIRLAYSNLWILYRRHINKLDLSQRGDGNLRTMNRLGQELEIDMIISSIPRTAWDSNDGNFRSSTVFAAGDAPDQGRWAPVFPPEDNLVICDAGPDTGWYRCSKVFGHATVEWAMKPPINSAAPVTKPLFHTSTVAQDMIHIGRYGEWKKGVLSTDAYDKVIACTA